VNTTGDGFLATFPSAVGALRAAVAIRDAVPGIGLQVRIGVHTGEVEQVADDIRGLAVHAAARIMALAGPSEILTSAATRGLVEGSGLVFAERGTHELKGLDRPMEVFALAST
jgi:class 3 adenylate cyclase